jgi:hypothetical protein
MGVPQNGWLIMENPYLKWMVWGIPISGNLQHLLRGSEKIKGSLPRGVSKSRPGKTTYDGWFM